MLEFWIAALALTVFLYVALDGIDLGVGMLMGLRRDEAGRNTMLSAISPVWDGNETWLVISAAVLFSIFPVVYSLLLSAFYLPLMAMLAALILRGVAFEFRENSHYRRIWDGCLIGGSFLAAFIQGAAIGALAEGLPVTSGHYVGGPFTWLSPFAVLCGLALCFGYMLLGAAWLIRKTDGEVQDFAFILALRLLVLVLAFLALTLAATLFAWGDVVHRWLPRPWTVAFPTLAAFCAWGIANGVGRRHEVAPLVWTLGLFAAAFATMAASFFPWIVPGALTLKQAAAPPSSQSFLFWGAGIVVLPITLVYTALVYTVFSGKARGAYSSDGR